VKHAEQSRWWRWTKVGAAAGDLFGRQATLGALTRAVGRPEKCSLAVARKRAAARHPRQLKAHNFAPPRIFRV